MWAVISLRLFVQIFNIHFMNKKYASSYANLMKKHILDYSIIFLSSIAYAAGIGLFLDPNNLAPGGITGICIILNRFLPIETGTLILLFNVPILLIGIWWFGFKFIFSTLYATVLVSFFTNFWSRYETPTNDKMLAAIIGASLVGGSIGVIFKHQATTGGIDIIIKMLRSKFKHLKTGTLFLVFDMSIVALSGLVFKDLETALYAGISVVTATAVLDVVLYGKDEAKLFFIVSREPERLGKALTHELDVGVTYLEGRGAYSRDKKQIILCVVRKHQAVKLEEAIKEIDKSAFTIVSSASEIFGEGFKNIAGDRL